LSRAPTGPKPPANLITALRQASNTWRQRRHHGAARQPARIVPDTVAELRAPALCVASQSPCTVIRGVICRPSAARARLDAGRGRRPPRAAHRHDYATVPLCEDSFASTGGLRCRCWRRWLRRRLLRSQIVGGGQFAYASWSTSTPASRLVQRPQAGTQIAGSNMGDIRQAEGAAQMVDGCLTA
jgi:hypothetical protein